MTKVAAAKSCVPKPTSFAMVILLLSPEYVLSENAFPNSIVLFLS